MLLLKHTYGLSDEQVWDRWVHDPYFQYFTGEAFFQHELVHERSGLSHWRKRVGDHLDILLQETLRLAHDTGALKKSDLARVTVDTTVQPKNITFPTDAKLLETAIHQLGRLAKKPLLAGCQTKAESDMGLAGAAVAERDDVLAQGACARRILTTTTGAARRKPSTATPASC